MYIPLQCITENIQVSNIIVLVINMLISFRIKKQDGMNYHMKVLG